MLWVDDKDWSWAVGRFQADDDFNEDELEGILPDDVGFLSFTLICSCGTL